MNNTLIISCHADTGFKNHQLQVNNDGDYYGHLDNFVGVYAVMNAYFSGKLNKPNTRIELTYGEENEMEGAHEAMANMHPNDTVIVVDVTGTRTKSDFTIEKCSDSNLKTFVKSALCGLYFDFYEGCPDPIACEDECDVYKEKLRKVCFLGIPCVGGDYNRGMVTARRRSVEMATQALIQLARAFSEKDDF